MTATDANTSSSSSSWRAVVKDTGWAWMTVVGT